MRRFLGLGTGMMGGGGGGGGRSRKVEEGGDASRKGGLVVQGWEGKEGGRKGRRARGWRPSYERKERRVGKEVSLPI